MGLMSHDGPGLLLAAFPPELAGLDRAPPEGWTVAVAGVGAVSAASATARHLARGSYSRALFLGTCGAYDARLAPGDLISASEVLATSLEELDGRAYRPEVEVVRWVPGFALPLPGHPVAAPPAITRTEEGARALARVATAEHLELSGVFAACSLAGVPVAAALAIANRVGPGAHAEWKARHEGASRALVEALRERAVIR